ncbi:uncharacterized protein LOC127095276 [Lathyrus oleraceus]|uniref:uncharacterized protein LOC127095276 n=1 Tax=Pisum sativum TaxID=3888 RepID=UPI0021D3C661|nr:uncharacterized protein LOC127095276 [Pisum sativum]
MAIRGPRSKMQQLLKLLYNNRYVSRYKVCEDKIIVRDTFWAHPESIKLFNTFLTVLVIDSTYKTNKYRLPLLEIVGVTSMEKTFSVGFVFLESEKEVNVTWASEMCKNLLKNQENMPNVIVTGRDTALMNSVAKVFPTSYTLHRHLGNITTNIVKFAHSTLKKWLGDSKGDFCREQDTLNQMLQNQHNEIKINFGRSITVLEHRFKHNTLYSDLVDYVSHAGLNFIFHEAKRVEKISLDSSKYGCTLRKTYDLPCACIISKKMKPDALDMYE